MPKGVKMEKYRPKIHFSAEDYIINDPNGLVYYKGEYHLFHQYNINEQIYWGHAVSKDLDKSGLVVRLWMKKISEW